MKNCIKLKNGDNGNSGHGINALNKIDGKNALDLLSPKKNIWVIETNGFFRKKRMKISAESIKLLPSGDISIALDSNKGQHMAISAGSWVSFYPADT
jgi:hypothetical protein